jgi:transcriptional regulator with GAF, ATPase, and Fis domain
MNSGPHERRLAQVFVELADTLVDDFDVLEFLSMLVERCVELLDVTAAGVVLSDQRGGLRMAAASSEQARLVELFSIQSDDGPCPECVRTGRPVSSGDLTTEDARWPRFAPAARAAGFHAAQAVPMRLRRTVIGAVSLLDTGTGGIHAASVDLGQALADVATIGMLQQRAIHDSAILAEQLHTALNSRVVIEQAKGVLSAYGGLDMTRAFTALRGHARAQNMRLSELARTVAEGTADLDAILGHKAQRSSHIRPEHR